MTCRDVRDVADSFLCDELLTETNHDNPAASGHVSVVPR